MTDLAFGLQKAIYTALTAAGVPVFEAVPEDEPTPYVIIGEDTIENIGGKDDRLEQHTVAISTVTDMQGKKAMRTMQEVVRAALDRRPITAPGCLFGTMTHTDSEDALLEDGVTYVGTQRFTTIAQPAS